MTIDDHVAANRYARRKTPESLTGIETKQLPPTTIADWGRKTPESLTGIETTRLMRRNHRGVWGSQNPRIPHRD